MAKAWTCVKMGSAACRRIIAVAPWMMAAYLAVHPLPTDCRHHNCHWVIPKREFLPGGMFATNHARPVAHWQAPAAAFTLAPLTAGTDGLSSPPAILPPNPVPPVTTTTTTTTITVPGGGPSILIPRPTPILLPQAQPVPEPPSALLLGGGVLALLALTRRPRPRAGQ